MTRIGTAGCTTTLLMRMSAPSPPGQVAVTTFLPARRSRTHSGSAVGSRVRTERADLVAADRRGEAADAAAIVAATGWNVLAGMSLWTAVEPVAMAICETAVSDGVAVTFWRATTPLRSSLAEPAVPSTGRRSQVFLDEVGPGAVQRDQTTFGDLEPSCGSGACRRHHRHGQQPGRTVRCEQRCRQRHRHE